MTLKFAGRKPTSAARSADPKRKYSFSRSWRPNARMTFRVYVPTPNSFIRRISMATFTGELDHKEHEHSQRRNPSLRVTSCPLCPRLYLCFGPAFGVQRECIGKFHDLLP